jgi:transcriptional regulator with XRE-family HTH domain
MIRSPLKELRLNAKMTIRELVKSSGLSIATVIALEKGRNKEIYTNVLVKISNTFDVNPNDFYDKYLEFHQEKQKEATPLKAASLDK